MSQNEYKLPIYVPLNKPMSLDYNRLQWWENNVPRILMLYDNDTTHHNELK